MVPYMQQEHRGQTHTSSDCLGVNESELQQQAMAMPHVTPSSYQPKTRILSSAMGNLTPKCSRPYAKVVEGAG